MSQPIGPPLTLLQSGYDLLTAGETITFALSPIPLEPIKAGIQRVGLPLATTAIATQIPGVGDLIATATHWGGDVFSNVAVDWAGDALNQFGQHLTANLQAAAQAAPKQDVAMWQRPWQQLNAGAIAAQLSAAQWIGNATTPMVLGATGIATQVAGQLATSATIGRGLIKGGQLAMRQAIKASQQAMVNTNAWLQSTWQQLKQRFGIEQTISQSQQAMVDTNAWLQSTWQHLKQQFGIEQTVSQVQNTLGVTNIMSEEQNNNGLGQSQDSDSGITPQSQLTNLQAEETSQGQKNQPHLAVDDSEDNDRVSALDTEETPDHSKAAIELQNHLGSMGYDIGEFEIIVNGENAFKMGGGDIAANSMNAELATMLHQIMHDPDNFRGEITIKVGDKVLYHQKDENIIVNTVRLNEKALNVKAVTASKALYEKAHAGVIDTSLIGVTQTAVNALKMGREPEEIKTALLNHDGKIARLKETKGPEAAEQAVDAAIAEAGIAIQAQKQTSQTQEKQLAAAAGPRR